MRINLVCVGKLTPLFTSLFDDYAKRVRNLAELNIVELREVNHDNLATQVARETGQILTAIANFKNPVLLISTGEEVDSLAFAASLNVSEITFIIGGSHGVDEALFKTKISFGRLTYPHQLFRIILAEQLFRGLSIIRNSPYHK